MREIKSTGTGQPILAGNTYLATLQNEPYNRCMKYYVRVYILFCLIFLSACGPREIGQNSSSDKPLIPEATAADLLRLPITGMNNTQRLLYWQNRPEVMMTMQKLQTEQFRRRMGLTPSPDNPQYREIPRQRSPFRQ